MYINIKFIFVSVIFHEKYLNVIKEKMYIPAVFDGGNSKKIFPLKI